MTPAQILSFAVAACAVIATTAVALVYVVPAFGLAFRLAVSGTAAGFTLAPALGSTMAYGTAALGAAAVVHLTVNVVTKARAQPLTWGGPVLAVVSGFLVQACEKYVSAQLQLVWPLLAAGVGVLVLVGAAIYSGGTWLHRTIGALLSLMPPAIVLAMARDPNGNSVLANLAATPLDVWGPVAVMFVVALVLGLVAHLDHQQRNR